jgi:serine/threonine-protein kinase
VREARSAAALNHPNICTIHEVGTAGNSSFIAMEFVDGRSLREVLDSGAVDLVTARDIGLQVADALAYAHSNNVVHRDLKAANVILTAGGQAKIVDFGLARRDDVQESTMLSAVPAGARAGTPYSMAPEQVRGDRADARADIWAMGVLLYEMSAGHHPFSAPSVPELFSAIMRDSPRPLPDRVPAAMRSIVERCLEKDPANRYQDAAQLGADLERMTLMPPTRATTRLRRLWPAAAVLAAAALGLVTMRDREPVPDPVPPAAAAAAPIKLAVLPFNNLTGDPEQEFFVDGLTDEAITQLGRLHPQRLSVIGHRSSMRYKNATAAVDVIGRELGVDYLLEGSARREGNRIRVTARLLQARDQIQIWTEVFDRELASLLSLQNEVARGVASALALTLLPEEQQRLAAAPPVNAEAYEAFLRGLGHAGKLSRADLDRALEYFNIALQKDPNFALAHIGISNVWSSRQQMQFVSPRDAAPRIRAALERAAALSGAPPAELEFAVALQKTWTDWRWQEGGEAFERALALRPNYAEARAFYAHYLMIMKRPQQSLEQIERAIALDPHNDLVQSLLGVVLMSQRRFDEAAVQFRRALETTPASPLALNGLSRAYHHAGRFDEGLAAERELWKARGDIDMVRLLSATAGGYHATLRRGADLQAARARKTGGAPLNIALMYIRAGARDEALDWLRRSFDARDPNIPYIAAIPNFADVKDDPRFIAVQQALGLP